MSGKHWLRLFLSGVLLTGCLSAAVVAAPWDSLFRLNRVEASPDKSYRLTKENGPWTIMACSFSGERAEEQARELALELRKRYKLPAYTYKQHFDFGENTYARGIDRFGRPVRARHVRGLEEIEEVAVMVGDFPSVDDKEAQETLQKLKYSRPQCLELDEGRPTSRSLAAWRMMQQYVLASGNAKKKKGPMGHAMITTNPLLGKDFYVPEGLDPLVLAANEGVEHCLLDCPGKYTVQVATFRGQAIIDQREISAIKGGRKKMKSELVEAAENAHKLTEVLRQKGHQAYEFHDRYASIVTVGSFDWVSRRLPDSRTEMNPAVKAVIDRWGPKQTSLGGQTGGLAQQVLEGIPLDMQPRPVYVPKRSVHENYNRGITRLF